MCNVLKTDLSVRRNQDLQRYVPRLEMEMHVSVELAGMTIIYLFCIVDYSTINRSHNFILEQFMKRVQSTII